MKQYTFDYTRYLDQLLPLFQEMETVEVFTPKKIRQLIKKYPLPEGGVFAKDQLVTAYRQMAGQDGLKPLQRSVIQALQMKPVRTQSGVTPLTVLTKPFPCPGKCIFCPSDVRMPKSYLSDEPGAQRAERNYFDPYLQTYNRLQAYFNTGHPIDKIEIIVLGGTWSYYPEAYQIWFIKECFRALNEFGQNDDLARIENLYQEMKQIYQDKKQHAQSNDPIENKAMVEDKKIKGKSISKSYNQTISEMYVAPERLAGFDIYQTATWEELELQHKANETAKCRNVGLVIETRPDNISEAEVMRIRRLGCTKTQIGFQSLQDDVLTKNNRGHDVAATRKAVALLRQAGFKIHAHWMANLHGSNVELDKQDYLKLFNDPDFCPDELKIYPCSLIESAELMAYYERGEWQPYSHEELLDVLTFCLRNTPEYCRLTRVIRDIPSTDIVEGNKLTNFRQIAEQELALAGEQSVDIRAREIRNMDISMDDLHLDIVRYETQVSQELFIQYVTQDEQKNIAAFLRLSLPKISSFVSELKDSAIIREIHVYGQSIDLGEQHLGKAQHLGLGKKLIEYAQQVAIDNALGRLSVISAIGTREYYRKRGFSDGELYQHLSLVQ